MLRRFPLTVVFTSCAFLVPATSAHAERAGADKDAFDLSVSAGADSGPGAGVKGEVDLELGISSFDFDLRGSAKAGQAVFDQDIQWSGIGLPLASPRSWLGGTVAFDATWSGPANSKIELRSSDELRLADRYPSFTAWARDMRHNSQAAKSLKAFSASIAPGGSLTLRLAASSIHDSKEAMNPLPADVRHTRTVTEQNEYLASLSWQAARRIRIAGSAGVNESRIGWFDGASSGASYAYLQPKFDLSVAPWAGSRWDFHVERAIRPVKTHDFVAFARVEDEMADVGLAPDREWIYRTTLDQNLSSIDLSATFAVAQIESVTELVRVSEETDAPASLAGGWRQEVGTSLSVPLKAVGLPETEFESQTVWRWSGILDPQTDKYRRLSGEVPNRTNLRLIRNFPLKDMRLGLEGQIVGDFLLYKPGALRMVSSGDAIGAFFEYKPEDEGTSFRLDAHIGRPQVYTDVYFDGGRGGSVDRVRQLTQSDTRFGFSFNRTFE